MLGHKQDTKSLVLWAICVYCRISREVTCQVGKHEWEKKDSQEVKEFRIDKAFEIETYSHFFLAFALINSRRRKMEVNSLYQV